MRKKEQQQSVGVQPGLREEMSTLIRSHWWRAWMDWLIFSWAFVLFLFFCCSFRLHAYTHMLSCFLNFLLMFFLSSFHSCRTKSTLNISTILHLICCGFWFMNTQSTHFASSKNVNRRCRSILTRESEREWICLSVNVSKEFLSTISFNWIFDIP